MSRNNSKNKKLALRTETLRQLSSAHLAAAVGGAPKSFYCDPYNDGHGARRTAMCNSEPDCPE